jgi:hypothetical protein
MRNVTNGPVTMHQESTYQPDSTWRWMGSAAMDGSGNLAIGYSASSSNINPQIRYSGRLASDPLNSLAQGEATLFAGTGSQTGTGNRWGDYSDLTVDPVDDCTFWYTQEYYATTSQFNWRTRIGSFKFPSCGSTGPRLRPLHRPPQPRTPTPTQTNTPTSTLSATSSPTSTQGASATPTATMTEPLLRRQTATPSSTAITFRSTAPEDGWILESSETSSMGGTLNTGATTFVVGDNAQDRQYRSILSFNTGSLPDNAIITRVTLKIKGSSTVGTNPFGTHGKLVVDVRKPFFDGSSALELNDFLATASKNWVGAIPNTPSSGWYTKTWTSGILSYINKLGRTQLRLRFSTADNDDLSADYLKFFSGNATTSGDRPKLIVQYYVP